MLRQTPVDIMLLDMVMPRLDGFGVLDGMRSLDDEHKPHVIALTAMVRDDLIQRAVSMGADYYMLKPFDIPQVLELLHISYRFTLLLFTFGPAAYVAVRIYKIPALSYVKTVADESKHYILQ